MASGRIPMDAKTVRTIKAIIRGYKYFYELNPDNPEQKQLRQRLASELVKTIDFVLAELGREIKASGRDPREPGKQIKEAFEKTLARAVTRHFNRQARAVRTKLETYHPDRKATAPPITWLQDADIWEDPEFEADLVLTLIHAAEHGIALFEEVVAIGIDYSIVNAGAAAWARKYAYDLVKGIDKTTRAALQKAVSAFVETPGMTIGQTMQLMPFDARRAERVAVTEITRAYASANRLAGEELEKEFPDMRVVKQWFTNNDGMVCTEICAPLNGKTVGLHEDFSPGVSEPPAHVNCRCWDSVTTELRDD